MTRMTVAELGNELEFTPAQTYAYLRNREIPIEKVGKKIGKHYVIIREKFEKWFMEDKAEELTDLRIINGKVRKILR